jgi:CAAX protease family protein
MKTRIAELGSKAEFAVVTGAAFGIFIFNNFRYVLFEYGHHAALTAGHLRFLIVFEMAMLPALYWFLRQRSWTAARMGAIPASNDLPIGIGLGIAAYVVYLAVWLVAAQLVPEVVSSIGSSRFIAGRFDLPTVLLVSIVNPIFEETFLCGYVVTAVAPARGPATAVSVSLVIRLLCHLYQGPLALIGVAPIGLVFTWYYARTQRLWPVVLAHAIFDFVGLVPYT